MIRSPRRARSLVACSDAGDVRPVKARVRIDGEPTGSPRARSRECARADDLRRRPLPPALWKAGRKGEAAAAEERVPRIDAVVDDADLDAVSFRARGGMELVRADHGRAAIRVECVAEAWVDLLHEAEPREVGQLGDRQLDGDPVEDDLEALLHARVGNRVPQLDDRAALRRD